MSEKLVSILLCSYNGDKYINQQIDSILNQTYSNFELIIVDDLSTDKTYSICEEYAIIDKRISLYKNETNLGLNKNFEKAITLAKGEYLAFSDQDDVWELDKINILIDLINKSGSVLVYSDSNMVDENNNDTGFSSMDHHVFINGTSSKSLLFYNMISGHEILFKKELVQYILPIPSSFWYDWWIGYIAVGLFSIEFTDEKLVNYRIHSESFVQKNKKSETRSMKIDSRINSLKYFRDSPVKSNYELIDQLIYGYNSLKGNIVSFSLYKTVSSNHDELLKSRLFINYGWFKKLKMRVKIGLGLKF